LLGLLKYNDNSINRYSDDHYRAALIGAVANTLSLSEGIGTARPDSTNSIIEEIIGEVTRALNKDTTNPSYSRLVASSCLRTIYTVNILCVNLFLV
jgi:transcription initiation factor TFIID subunit 2